MHSSHLCGKLRPHRNQQRHPLAQAAQTLSGLPQLAAAIAPGAAQRELQREALLRLLICCVLQA
jgi:hypothetical protein